MLLYSSVYPWVMSILFEGIGILVWLLTSYAICLIYVFNNKHAYRELKSVVIVHTSSVSCMGLCITSFVLDRIPFWSGVRLAVIFCLVMPQFEGACLAYQGLVGSFIDRFDMLMEERLCKRRTFLDVVDKYINENGPEALEKLIASQMTPPEARVENRCLETPLLKKSEQEWTCGLCKMTSVGESTLNAHLQGSMHKSKLEILRAILLNAKDTGSSPLWQVQHTRSFSAAWDLRGTYAAAEFKERMPPKEPENTLLKKAEQEWTCDLCKVTMASKSMLNAHLQGSKHKTKLESPKACLLDSKDTGPSPLVDNAQSIPAGWDLKGTYAAAEVKQIMPPKETAEKSGPETPLHEKTHQEWNCDQCKVITTDPLTLNGHLQWGEDNAKLQTILNESLLDAKDTGTILPLVQHTQPVSAAWDLNGTLEADKDKELMLPKETKETRLPETPLFKKAQQEWTEFITTAEYAQSVPAGWDMNGTLEAVKDKEMMSPKETAEMRLPETPLLKKSQQDMTGDMSKVTTESELMLNDHLQGSQHKSKLETTLKASLLEAKDTGPSPSVQHLQSVSAAWDLNGTYAAFEEEKIMPLKEAAERRLPATPLLKKDKQEWTGDLCKVPTESVSTLNDHLEESNPNSKLETTLEVERAPSIPAAWEPKGSYAAAEAKEILSPKETAEKWGTGTPLLKKSCQEWTCDLCKVTTPGEISLNGHLQGHKHKATQKRSRMLSKNGRKWSRAQTQGQPRVRSPEIPLVENAQQKWTSDPCKVITKNKMTLNGHLQETRHKDKLEFTMKEGLLELEKHAASKNGHVEGRDSHRDVQVVKSEARNGSPAALKEVQYMQPIEVPECTYSNTEVKETKPPLKASRAGNPPFKKERIVKSEAKNGSSALQEVQYAQPLEVLGQTNANTLRLKRCRRRRRQKQVLQ
ncbi:uncharacterized protein LOC121758595 isoform X2 [Salvia splendens]|uniref:uncharacterized protein LOC121758595 isoform X2 n=1 Tax=Salvia splendens TaxID=180675 RepID=UPI001C27B506|nr:uncharacterized protein LOC121758595 isoform X2 [Salvia splendens]